jgi:hypothetical protein
MRLPVPTAWLLLSSMIILSALILQAPPVSSFTVVRCFVQRSHQQQVNHFLFSSAARNKSLARKTSPTRIMESTCSSSSSSGKKCSSPSAERNREPIWNVLESQIINKYYKNQQNNGENKKPLRVLEIAAGAGGRSVLQYIQYCTVGIMYESLMPLRVMKQDVGVRS